MTNATDSLERHLVGCTACRCDEVGPRLCIYGQQLLDSKRLEMRKRNFGRAFDGSSLEWKPLQ